MSEKFYRDDALGINIPEASINPLCPPLAERGEPFPEMESVDNYSLPRVALMLINAQNAIKELQDRVAALEGKDDG